VRLNAAKAEGKTMVINWNFTDSDQRIALNLDNSALTYVAGKQAPNADATVTLARDTLDAVTLQQTTFADAVKAGLVKIDGDPRKPDELMSMLDTFKVMFEVVEPKARGQ
jgi:linear primary-alkylsulfatase